MRSLRDNKNQSSHKSENNKVLVIHIVLSQRRRTTIKPRLRIIIADDNRDVTAILAGTFGLKGYEVYKTFSAEECLNKVNELDGRVEIVFVDGKIAADRAAILIIKVKRINPDIKIMALAEDETDKTRVLDYGADEFATKPISAETIVDKVSSLLLTTEHR